MVFDRVLPNTIMVLEKANAGAGHKGYLLANSGLVNQGGDTAGTTMKH